MKITTLGLAIAIPFALFSCSNATSESSESDAEMVDSEDGFVSLLSGDNLDAWVGDKAVYGFKDGVITVNPDEKGTEGSGGNLYTEKEYSDFIFKFEFQLTPGANNGFGFHAPLEGDAAYVGKELQILDNTSERYADLHEYQYHGSLYGVMPAKKGFLKPVGEWNQEEIQVEGSNVKVTLNGTVILDGDYMEASKDSTLDHKEHPGLMRTSGHLGFLGHGEVLSFRNIMIKDLAEK